MSSLTLQLQEWQCIFSNKTAQHSFQAGNSILFLKVVPYVLQLLEQFVTLHIFLGSQQQQMVLII